jgi:hypothetical protein
VVLEVFAAATPPQTPPKYVYDNNTYQNHKALSAPLPAGENLRIMEETCTSGWDGRAKI